MSRIIFITAGFLLALLTFTGCQLSKEDVARDFVSRHLRAPAYPLVTIDPYISAWSTSDKLFDTPVKHWTDRTHSLIGVVRVDGQAYRFLGQEDIPLKTIVPLSMEEEWKGRYQFSKPSGNWTETSYNDGAWKEGAGAFGTRGHQNARTVWESEEIWVRRTFVMPENVKDAETFIRYSHDDDFQLYLNGHKIIDTGNSARRDQIHPVDRGFINYGEENVIAVYCRDRGGAAYVDFGVSVESDHSETFVNTAVQKSVELSATRTFYEFTCGPVDLNLTFVSPLIPDDLDLLSRPVNFIEYQVASNDGAAHDVQVYFEITPEWAVNEPIQEVHVSTGETEFVEYVKAGTVEQPILGKSGDDVRIDWGYVYLAAAKTETSGIGLGDYFAAKNTFLETGACETGNPDLQLTDRPNRNMAAMYFVDDLAVDSKKKSDGYFVMAYDDVESIQYFGENLKGYWSREGTFSIEEAIDLSILDYQMIVDKCAAFDKAMWADAINAGGEKYAELCVLAYRQAVAAHKLVKDSQGNTLFLSKENNSNGSIGTVDVSYPSSPLFMKYNTELLKGMMNPIFYYSESGKWVKPFAAHDVGTYPLANGQTYGGDMPIEESGNMLIMAAAIAHYDGHADYAAKHWQTLTTWVEYLAENGLDPDEQLCTDDFAGHFAHNANLSLKAILAIASYGRMAQMLGKEDETLLYTDMAREMAQDWMAMADDGDHYRLTFDKPGTWSQKYNLVWDKLLGLDIFPEKVTDLEVAYYLTKQDRYGLPLDSRMSYTKSDWVVWTATLADDRASFEAFINPLYDYVHETPDRVPMSDWYDTNQATRMNFKARSVVGGYFIKMLE